MKNTILKSLPLILLTIFISGCDNKPKTTSLEVKKVHFDRDMCDRCKMVISEKNHVAQVINPNDGKAYKFDDIGCAILWFKENNITWKKDAKIWIADIKSANYLDAKTSHYDTMNITPMAYGFGAHEKKENIKTDNNNEIIDFEEMSKRVLKKGI